MWNEQYRDVLLHYANYVRSVVLVLTLSFRERRCFKWRFCANAHVCRLTNYIRMLLRSSAVCRYVHRVIYLANFSEISLLLCISVGNKPQISPSPVVVFLKWHFIDLFSCVAASLFNKLTYLRIRASTYYVVLLAHPRLRPRPHVNRAAAFLLLTVNCHYKWFPKMPFSWGGS